MRRLFATALIAVSAACVPLAYAGNQEEANRIAKSISAAYPQYTIEVAYKNGKVRLRGEVGSEMERQQITQLVGQLPAVSSVSADSIQVGQAEFVAANVVPQAAAVNAPVSTMAPAQLSQSQMYPAMPGVDAGFENYSKIAQNSTSTIATEAASDMSGGLSLSPAPVQNYASEGSFNYDQSYAPAPQGIPVAAGQNGQNGEPNLPNYAWPTTADYPNYAQVGYPKQYAASAFPYIGPFYPYPQVPLGWRKVTMEWHDGYWWLDFNDGAADGPFSPLFRQPTKYR